jgi:septum formation protein
MGKRAFGKPADGRQAAAFLACLSGREHWVITGVAVGDVKGDCWAAGSELTHVRFRRLSQREIREYVRSGEAFGKAGAYAIQGRASRFVSQIRGPLDNVIGLPIKCLARVVSRVVD